jgi:hypothetical protein
MSEEQIKAWIDSASYEDLLRKWRTAPAGDPFFQGKMGDYYSVVMSERRAQVGPDEAARISKFLV